MHTRIDYTKFAPDAVKAILGLEQYVNSSGLEQSLLELIKLRASQINGCAYCVDMHSADAQKAGESERRLHSVVVWRESPFFTARERAALAWTEAVTLLSETHVPDDIYNEVLTCFGEKEIIALTMAIISINSWNRIAVSFRKLPS
ncbi:carboxymuconolactone decarboxylase family protein [Fluoribacter gormanii]|uniref:Alkylhydroperoxidase AhpD family core domain-containing protein n=1 Tax=Fluoribacter gormanii TaxID=464 RepID=A0A377GIC6_9GAMM|nr:carboxymuconolactone decarboxylase family protein [Fluoribacter gormanii]KTD01296.1 putative Carboxymuconolactone decarboxylase [Fluoribacter gormanii]MCW8444122.1 carboxymuconolactone decarboxylase family protein [Fluoribacter gormanii]MCW8469304.1 carboxymuconolactone decarboxylase family protein [Fluoribacter gormanii]SIR81201.1 alkylhydroperoxidase AhpD family core domain-containing protein [Fluoribacter gormanii]STO24313.1 Argininosuccinate synthase [Fluoribacter gormanii]